MNWLGRGGGTKAVRPGPRKEGGRGGNQPTKGGRGGGGFWADAPAGGLSNVVDVFGEPIFCSSSGWRDVARRGIVSERRATGREDPRGLHVRRGGEAACGGRPPRGGAVCWGGFAGGGDVGKPRVYRGGRPFCRVDSGHPVGTGVGGGAGGPRGAPRTGRTGRPADEHRALLGDRGGTRRRKKPWREGGLFARGGGFCNRGYWQ